MASGASRFGCEKDSHGEENDENETRDRVIANHVIFIASPQFIRALRGDTRLSNAQRYRSSRLHSER